MARRVILRQRPGGVHLGQYASIKVVLTAAEVRALNATPQTLVYAKGAGMVIMPESVVVRKLVTTAAFGGIATGEDLTLRYTDEDGTALLTVETTGFLDAAAASSRLATISYFNTVRTAAAANTNVPLVLANSGAITLGGAGAEEALEIAVVYSVVRV